MRIGFRHLSTTTVDWAASAAESSTRSSLARGLCEREEWRNAKGELCLASARAGLPDLAASLDIVLPAPRPHAFDTLERDYPDRLLAGTLEDLGEVTVEPVGEGEDKRLARSMMATWHPEACAPGARGWITSSRHGRLGGLVFGAASWHQKARDDFWSQGARVLGEIVNNDRFLILPSCEGVGLPCPGLPASGCGLA